MPIEHSEPLQKTPSPEWPTEPYKGLAYYTAADVALYVGRASDVDDCVNYLSEARTRTLLLHGRTGCGKSSFLRAGLIPILESRGFGFKFFGHRKDKSGPIRPSFIRSGPDPVARIAEELYNFISEPIPDSDMFGDTEVDLRPELRQLSKEDFIATCEDPEFLIEVFRSIGRALSHTLVVVLDQAEEVLTLTKVDDESRRHFFAFLRLFNTESIGVKLVIAFRKEYFGEFFGLMHVGASVKTDVKQRLLGDLDADQVRAAILRPTLGQADPPLRPPLKVYGFQFDDDAVDAIVAGLFASAPAGGILPVMQIVCRDLYREVPKADAESLQAQPWRITLLQFEAGGGITGRIDKHLTNSIRGSLAECEKNKPKLFGSSDREVALEEARWRTVLHTLVHRHSDGLVETSVITEREFRAALMKSGTKVDLDCAIDFLTNPEVLILRRFNSLTIDRAHEETFISLGHDAIGQALHEWKSNEQQKLLVLESQALASRRLIVLLVVLLISFVVGMTAGVTRLSSSISAARQEVRELLLAANRNLLESPWISIAAAVEAADREAKINGRFGVGLRFIAQKEENAKRYLSWLLASLPEHRFDLRTMKLSDGADLTTDLGPLRFLPFSGQWVVRAGDAFSQNYYIGDSSTGAFNSIRFAKKDGTYPDTECADSMVTQSPSGAVLLLCQSDGSITIRVVEQGEERKAYERQDLLDAAGLRRGAPLVRLSMTDNVVAMTIVGRETGPTRRVLVVSASGLSRGADIELPYPKAKSFQTGDLIVKMPDASDGVRFVSRTAVRLLEVEGIATASVYDARAQRGDKLWDFAPMFAGSESLIACRRGRQNCRLTLHAPVGGPDRLFVLVVAVSASADENKDAESSVSDFALILIDPKTGDFRDIKPLSPPVANGSRAELAKTEDSVANTAVLPQDALRAGFSMQHAFEARGTLTKAWVIQKKVNVLDIYRVSNRPSDFVYYGSVLQSFDPSDPDEFLRSTFSPFLAKGDTFLAKGDKVYMSGGPTVASWDLNRTVESTARALFAKSLDSMIASACERGHGQHVIKKGEWFEKTNRPEDAPPDRCSRKESAK